MNWTNITLGQYNRLQDVIKSDLSDVEKTLQMAQIVFGDDVVDLNIPDFNKKVKEMDFLRTEIPTKTVVKKCVLNGTTYEVLSNLAKFSTAQYIDFQNLFKTGEINKYLAPFFIPKGHKYNDDYDMEQVMNDLLSLDMVSVNSLSFFFKRQYLLFIKIFQHYSMQKLKKQKTLTKEMKKEMMQAMKDFGNSASYLLS